MLWKTYDMRKRRSAWRIQRGAIWQPPAIDPKRVCSTSVPATLHRPAGCGSVSKRNSKAQCAARDDHFDSALALDLKTGADQVAKGLQDFDTFTTHV